MVYYEPRVIDNYNRDSYFWNFNYDPIDSLLRTFDQEGHTKYRVFVNNQGSVVKVIEIKTTFTQKNTTMLTKAVQQIDWIPYSLPKRLATTVMTFKYKQGLARYSGYSLRPIRQNEVKKYELTEN